MIRLVLDQRVDIHSRTVVLFQHHIISRNVVEIEGHPFMILKLQIEIGTFLIVNNGFSVVLQHTVDHPNVVEQLSHSFSVSRGLIQANCFLEAFNSC